MQQVHLRINDAATGKPTPVRVRITDAAGTYYAPFGRLTEFAHGVSRDVGGNVMIGVKKWAYIDGACEILLPSSWLHIEIEKGPEYKPLDERITLLAGKMSLRFTIERWCDMRKLGWYSGDTRAHFLSPDAALLEGRAEDLAVVNLLAKEMMVLDTFGKAQRAIPNILSFSGQAFARSAGDCGVAVNTHNVHPQLGSLGLLHCHRVVYPLTLDAPDWALDDWCGQCHRKKGLVVWTDPQHETDEFLCGEPLADLILGNIDAFELTFFGSPHALVDYMHLLEAGLQVPLVGASAKDSNCHTLGSMRTYAYVPTPEEFSYSRWIEAVRAGQTFVSNGPLLSVTIDGRIPTQRQNVAAGAVIRVRVEAKSRIDFERFELLWNGQAIEGATVTATEGVLERELTCDESGWLVARCHGASLNPRAPQRLFAQSSPIWIQVPDRPYQPHPDAVERLLRELDRMITWAQRRPSPRLLHVVEEARTMLAKKLS